MSFKPWFAPKKKVAKDNSRALVDKLDRVFSEWVRLRDCNKDGYIKCVTSGALIHWTEADAGHFMSREHMNTRWDERNVNAQGRGDNRFKSGKQFEHGLAIDKKHGAGTAAKLHIASKMEKKWQAFELEAMAGYYRSEVKRLKKEKFGE
jgi:hypothetical protein